MLLSSRWSDRGPELARVRAKLPTRRPVFIVAIQLSHEGQLPRDGGIAIGTAASRQGCHPSATSLELGPL
jgi:hypothetical protein